MITKETATDIALVHREIETAQELLAEIEKAQSNFRPEDVRDAFGRPVHGLQLGVPSGNQSQRLFNVQWSLAKPVIEAHIAQCKSRLFALNEKAKEESKTNDQ